MSINDNNSRENLDKTSEDEKVDITNKNNKKKQNKKRTSLLTYLILIIVSLIIAKWIILLLPINKSSNDNIQEKNEYNKTLQQQLPKIKEIELSINFKELKPQIEKKYQETLNYIDNECIADNIEIQKENSYYRLSKSEDNFLDWLFGWWTGYKIVWHKLKGIVGSENNEIKYIQTKFQHNVINPGFDNMYKRVNQCVQNALSDYYKDVVTMTKDYINNKIESIKLKGYVSLKIDYDSVPWDKYIVAGVSDTFAVAGIGKGTLGLAGFGATKVASSKISSLVASKSISIVSSKVGSIIGSKIVAGLELFLAPLIDYLANEGVKKLEYNDTKKSFEKIIDTVFSALKKELIENAHYQAEIIKNNIIEELNKQVKIKVKIEE